MGRICAAVSIVSLCPMWPSTSCITTKAIDLTYGTENFLGHLRNPGPYGRFHSAALVGLGRDDSRLLVQLVGCLSQRLVLRRAGPTAICSPKFMPWDVVYRRPA